jgi:hypothetical protein
MKKYAMLTLFNKSMNKLHIQSELKEGLLSKYMFAHFTHVIIIIIIS